MKNFPAHKITVCTACRNKERNCRPGNILIKQLRAAIAAADDVVAAHFTVAEVTCMAACSRPCVVAFQAEQKASYVFGDMHSEEDVADILAFARQYVQLHDGWCSSVDRPGKLRTNTIARIPAMLPCTQASEAIL